MNLYLISQTENSDYDTYDSAVVCANDAAQARNMDPASGEAMTALLWKSNYSHWAHSPEAVTVTFLGKAQKGSVVGIVCASYRAG